jgi:hypothetical protein
MLIQLFLMSYRPSGHNLRKYLIVGLSQYRIVSDPSQFIINNHTIIRHCIINAVEKASLRIRESGEINKSVIQIKRVPSCQSPYLGMKAKLLGEL